MLSIYCAPFPQVILSNLDWKLMIAGSTTILVAPLRGIQAQLKSDCDEAGISALVGEQVEQVTSFLN